MNISNRLLAVASLIDTNNIVADIGTDHGYIPIYMVKEKGCKKAFAMDVNRGPLLRAKENIAVYNISDQIETRLSDGMKGLEPGEAETIVIAGMGGMLINKIITEGMSVAKAAKELILSPHSDLGLVRKFLSENNFCITEEKIVYEDEKYYFILKVVNGVMKINDDFELEYGHFLIENKDEIFYGFLNMELDKRLRILDKLKNSENVVRIQEINKEIELIRKGLLTYES